MSKGESDPVVFDSNGLEYSSLDCQTSVHSSRSNRRRKNTGSSISERSFDFFRDDEPFLQSRKLDGDSSKKGQPWRVQRHPTATGNEEQINIAKENGTGRKNNTKSQTSPLKPSAINAFAEHRNEGKIHVVACKKTQYGHLVSDQNVMPKDATNRPIVYRRKESKDPRQEVAPLWFHPISSDSSNNWSS